MHIYAILFIFFLFFSCIKITTFLCNTSCFLRYYIYESARDTHEVLKVKKDITKEDFCKLYGQYKDKLYRYALYRLGSLEDAEDAVSDAVLAAWQSKAKLRDTDAFGSWMFTILSNTCNSHIKKMIKNREKLERAKASEETLGDLSVTAYVPGSLSTELSEAMSILSDEERSIVLLSVIGGMNSKEIAKTTDLTAGAVRSKLSRSLAKMREFLS